MNHSRRFRRAHSEPVESNGSSIEPGEARYALDCFTLEDRFMVVTVVNFLELARSHPDASFSWEDDGEMENKVFIAHLEDKLCAVFQKYGFDYTRKEAMNGA